MTPLQPTRSTRPSPSAKTRNGTIAATTSTSASTYAAFTSDTLAGTNTLGQLHLHRLLHLPTDGHRVHYNICAPDTGFDFADFLLGLPQQAAIQAGQLQVLPALQRGTVQDDWRALANLTLTYGLRYEYFSPYSEKYNRLANLNLAFGPTIQNGNSPLGPCQRRSRTGQQSRRHRLSPSSRPS